MVFCGSFWYMHRFNVTGISGDFFQPFGREGVFLRLYSRWTAEYDSAVFLLFRNT